MPQCQYAAALGYEGLEVAPFTLSDAPDRLDADRRRMVRRAAADAGIEIIGLHWLLVAPPGLSLNGRDDAARARTIEVMRRLIGLCADLGGRVLVHGSPAQRSVAPDDDPASAWARARDAFAAVADDAEAAGVTYCVEPLARRETNFVNTVEDAPTGLIGHVQVNDSNRRGPGQGPDRFAPVFAALARAGYEGVVSVEPFEYHPDGRAAAARAIGYIRGILEAQR